MCIICDGTSETQAILLQRERLERHGWTAIFVESDRFSPSLSYSIGLIAYGHPELVLSGAPPGLALDVFNDLAVGLTNGEAPLLPASTIEAAGHIFRVVDVDADRLAAGLLAWWPRVFPHCACHGTPMAVQLIALGDPPEWDGDQQHLDRPSASSRKVDRAELRRRARRERKGRSQP